MQRQPLQHSFNRTLGVISLLIAIGYIIPLVRNKATLKSIIQLFFICLISLPLIAVLSFIPVLITSYNQYLPITSGIPSIITLSASEVFAFTWEAWLINRINRNTCSIKRDGLLSLLINTVSLILKLIILPPIAHVSY